MSARYTIRFHPGYAFGGPITEHGGHAEPIAEHIYAGETVDAIAQDYGVTRAEVLAACAYMELQDRCHRPPSRRKWSRWETWGNDAYTLMAQDADPDTIPDPPDADS